MMPPNDEQDEVLADIVRSIAAKHAAQAADITERARTVREVFHAGGAKRQEFLDSFALKIEDMFWGQMRQCGGDFSEPPLSPPQDWHLIASAVVLALIRELLRQAELSSMDEESLMGIAQVTLDAITGREVKQLDRKWLGLELREDSAG